MHSITILHRILSTSFPVIHAKRLASLLVVVEAGGNGQSADAKRHGARADRLGRRPAQYQTH
ncbi:hypothetical protein NTGHW29_70027 [Candidatus Nitrotoga sp. HW29]|nr:hypothetical protein NTGHW29_70027 [Candidatus Nitrotoga sp. HW29]